MDLSYATIPVFGGEYRRLYKEVHLAYLVSDTKHPNNHPIYSIEENFGSCMLQLSDDFERVLQVHKDILVQKKKEKPYGLWKKYFDGTQSRGAVVGKVFVSPHGATKILSYRLEFKRTTI